MIKSIFKIFFLSLCIIANTHFAYAQTASILPQGKTQFLDNNGKPLTSGTVDFYIPSTTTRKTTWQNSAETVANSNPVVLDAGGRAIIYGDGSYRQVVKDRLGNVIWDQVTSSTGSGSGGSTATGDGDLVGTIKPWAGMTAPNQYVFTYGQEISRTTYSALFTAITSSQSVFCTSGSPTLTGLSDTTNFWVGASVEVSCLAAGFSTIISKTSSSITLASNANVSTNVTAIIFPWGRGNGTTTFNVPDLRGFAIAGNNNMGGVASSRLTTTYFGSADPNSIGAAGGNQSRTFSISEIPGHNHPVFLNDPTHTHGHNANSNNSSSSTGGGGFAIPAPIAATINSASTGVTIRDTSGLFGTTNQTNLSGGGIAVSATLGNIGSGYTNGSQTITISGGTCTTQPQFTVTVSGNVFTGTPALLTAGSCTVAPNNPAATTGGGGTGGTLNVTYSAQPISLIQPTKTSNYIIKITPDTNSATASGVTSLGGMTGDIACGTGLLCTGNNISVTTIPLTIGQAITGGTDTRILYDNAGALGEYAISGTGNVAMTNSPTFVTPALGTPSSGVATNLTGLPLTTGVTGILPLSNGGTNASLTASNGGIAWSNTTQLQILNGTGTANLPMLSGSLATPAWAAITYPTSANSGGVPYFLSSTSMASSATLNANQIMVGGGAGAAPTTFACATTTTLIHGGTPPTCSQLAYADIATAAIATGSEYLAGTSSKLVQAGTMYQAETTTTYGATTTFDFSTFINTAVTLTGNITTQTLSNVTAGKAGTITFIQDGTGSRTTVWNSIFKFASGVTPTLTTTASAVDILSYSCRSATFCVAFLTKDAK